MSEQKQTSSPEVQSSAESSPTVEPSVSHGEPVAGAEPADSSLAESSLSVTEVEKSQGEETASQSEAPEGSQPLPQPATADPEHQLPEPVTASAEHQLPQPGGEHTSLPSPAQNPEAQETEQQREEDAEVSAQSGEGSPSKGEETVPEKKEEDEVFAELLRAKAQGTPIEVTGLRRIRNGILVQYKTKTLFLPVSKISEKPNPPENEILSFIKKTFPVHVEYIYPDERRRIVVTRKEIIRQARLSQLKEGDVIEGRVIRIMPSGVLVDLGGIEGMVYMRNLAPQPVKHPEEVVKRNEKVRVEVLSVDRERGRVSLSMRDFIQQRREEQLAQVWDQIEQDFAVGTRLKGKVSRIVKSGVWVELKPGIEGWLRISELSWARRLRHPSQVVSEGEEIEVEVIGLDAERKRILLSYRQTQPNPWETIEERFPIGTRVQAIVSDIQEKGVIVNLADDVDAFLPRSKMLPELQRQKQPFAIGDTVEVLVMDVEPDKRSLIVGMEGFDRRSNRSRFGGNRPSGRRQEIPAERTGRVRLAELLSEEERKKLFGESVEESSSETSSTVGQAGEKEASSPSGDPSNSSKGE